MSGIPIDHATVCKGDQVCNHCGRPICEGCSLVLSPYGAYVSSSDHRDLYRIRDRDKKCLYCTGKWKPENVILRPAPNGWDE